MITAQEARDKANICTANANRLSAEYGREYANNSINKIENEIIQRAEQGENYYFFYARIPETCKEYKLAQRVKLQDTPVNRKIFYHSCFDTLKERLTPLGYKLQQYDDCAAKVRNIAIWWNEPNS